jgi:hypothetical protein
MRFPSLIVATTAAVGTLLMAAACRPIVEDPSQFAAESRNSTMLLGSSCRKDIELGYGYCPLRENQTMPNLELFFMNAAEYAVSDCELGIHATGGINAAGSVIIDLSDLTAQIQKNHFCLLRVEAVERYPDPKDPTQKREIPLTGGFFIEVLEDGYFPVPTDQVVSWCYKISGTNKGRRKIEDCVP